MSFWETTAFSFPWLEWNSFLNHISNVTPAICSQTQQSATVYENRKGHYPPWSPVFPTGFGSVWPHSERIGQFLFFSKMDHSCTCKHLVELDQILNWYKLADFLSLQWTSSGTLTEIFIFSGAMLTYQLRVWSNIQMVKCSLWPLNPIFLDTGRASQVPILPIIGLSQSVWEVGYKTTRTVLSFLPCQCSLSNCSQE